MPHRKTFITIASLLILIGLLFIIISLLPFPSFKSIADSLTRDGNLKSLNEGNAIIFRILIGSGGLLFWVASFVIGTGRLKNVLAWLYQYYLDLNLLFRNLKPAKYEVFPLVILLLTIGSAFVFRIARINEQLTHDEGYTFVVFSSTSLFNILTNYHLPNNHILNSLLIYFSTHIFGIQPWVIRLPTMTAGLLLIPATYVLAKKIYDKYAALLSAIFLVFLPGVILYSTTARGYSFVALFTVLSLIIAYYVKENKNLFAWSLLVLFSALGFYSVPVMLIPFGMVFAWLFLENLFTPPGAYGSKFNFLKYWMSAGFSTAALVLILYTPIFIYSGAEKVLANQWVTPRPWAGYISSIPNQIRGVWSEWIGNIPFIWSIILVVGFCLSLALYRKITQNRFPLQIAAILWFALFMLIRRPGGATKVWAFMQAPFVIWSAAGIMGLIKGLRFKFVREVSVAAILVCISLSIVYVDVAKLAPTIVDRWNQKGPAENTILAIKGTLTPNDLIIVDQPYDSAIWYYSRLYGLSDNYFNKNLPFERLYVIVISQNEQSVESVLESRGPNQDLIDLDAAHLAFNYGYLDTYIIPHR